MMTIGDLSRKTGVKIPTIRYYEEIGLVRPLRDTNGYRAFRESDIHKLTFLGRSRALGFTIEDCRVLLSLYEDKSRASSDVKGLAARHLEQIGEKIAALESMRDTLTELVDACHGDHRPDCPILSELAHRK